MIIFEQPIVDRGDVLGATYRMNIAIQNELSKHKHIEWQLGKRCIQPSQILMYARHVLFQSFVRRCVGEKGVYRQTGNIILHKHKTM